MDLDGLPRLWRRSPPLFVAQFESVVKGSRPLGLLGSPGKNARCNHSEEARPRRGAIFVRAGGIWRKWRAMEIHWSPTPGQILGGVEGKHKFIIIRSYAALTWTSSEDEHCRRNWILRIFQPDSLNINYTIGDCHDVVCSETGFKVNVGRFCTTSSFYYLLFADSLLLFHFIPSKKTTVGSYIYTVTTKVEARMELWGVYHCFGHTLYSPKNRTPGNKNPLHRKE